MKARDTTGRYERKSKIESRLEEKILASAGFASRVRRIDTLNEMFLAARVGARAGAIPSRQMGAEVEQSTRASSQIEHSPGNNRDPDSRPD